MCRASPDNSRVGMENYKEGNHPTRRLEGVIMCNLQTKLLFPFPKLFSHIFMDTKLRTRSPTTFFRQRLRITGSKVIKGNYIKLVFMQNIFDGAVARPVNYVYKTCIFNSHLTSDLCHQTIWSMFMNSFNRNDKFTSYIICNDVIYCPFLITE